ncbi:transcriptional regulator [Massilia sp. DD77]|uniref:transcriptional regulator n=1 Tax=Massilia sp. DD77 TaxID=3109349 RepID=UPI002FFDAB41
MPMDKLLKYLNSLSKDERAAYVAACGTSEGYLRKAASRHQSFRAELCILLERESKGEVRCEDLLPDADWAYIRSKSREPGALTRSSDRKPDPAVP